MNELQATRELTTLLDVAVTELLATPAEELLLETLAAGDEIHSIAMRAMSIMQRRLPIPRELIEDLIRHSSVSSFQMITVGLQNDAWAAVATLARLGAERTSNPGEHLSSKEVMAEFLRAQQHCRRDPQQSRHDLLEKELQFRNYVSAGLEVAELAGIRFWPLEEYWQANDRSGESAREHPDSRGERATRTAERAQTRSVTAAFTQATRVVPTDEQQRFLDAAVVARGNTALTVEALAGTGKTTLCEFVGERLRQPRKIYLAFNRVMAQQALSQLGEVMESRTMDSLAYSVVKPWEIWGEQRLKRGARPQWSVIADQLALPPKFGMLTRGSLARLVYQTVLNFCYSEDGDVCPHHAPTAGLPQGFSQHLQLWGAALWDRMVAVDQDIPIPPAQVLKWWQLGPTTLDYEVVLYDEAQDACPAFAHILRRSPGLLLAIGDPHQQLYTWRGAQDIMPQLLGSRFPLTLSWRFGEEIAALANGVLRAKTTLLNHSIVGNSGIRSRVHIYEGPDRHPEWPITILARTNAQVFRRAVEIAERGHRLHVVGHIEDLRWLLLEALRLYRGQPVQHPRLVCFESWDSLVAEAALTAEPELKRIREVIETRHAVLEKQLEELNRRHEPDPLRASAILATTHKVKGREWDRVMLADDFIKPTELTRVPGEQRDAELNILYVAVTRARRELYIPREIAGFGTSRT